MIKNVIQIIDCCAFVDFDNLYYYPDCALLMHRIQPREYT